MKKVLILGERKYTNRIIFLKLSKLHFWCINLIKIDKLFEVPIQSQPCVRSHLELVSLACVRHCHICCPNPSSEYAWNRVVSASKILNFVQIFAIWITRNFESNYIKLPCLSVCLSALNLTKLSEARQKVSEARQ